MVSRRTILWLAEGLGAGRIPFAPGTWGSVVGMVWCFALLLPGNFWIYTAGTIAGIAASVRFCGQAEAILGRTDPPSVVLDEIAAVPLCFAGWVVPALWRDGAFPPLERVLSAQGWMLVLGTFAAFRFFDVLKPWPVGASQHLPGGWGITADDCLAALYVNALVMAVHAFAG